VRTLLILTIVASLALILLVNVPPLTDCHLRGVSTEKERWISASKVVVRPWRGRHHTYGIFHVPVEYAYNPLYVARLKLDGLNEEFSDIDPEDREDRPEQSRDPAYYNKLVYVPTRTALWFLLTGRFGDFNTPCHWWLIIADRVH
jgi:hypothetical protein